MKRIVAVLLVFCLALSICACSKNKGPNADSNGANNGIYKAIATDTNPTVMGTFYRNVTGVDLRSNDPAVKAVDEKADAMLKKIEEYPDTLKPADGGKTYYISNKGNDSNDGLSPEKARATYLSIKTFLQPGDLVLFERGGLWRGQMSCKEGVSYGAYGEGIKPRFYGSVDASKNGAGVWEETDTAGVYMFNKTISEYSNIVFNNGEAIGRPVQKMEDITERELNVVYKSGKVYLYCPKGNPQDVYEVIEIAEGYTLITGDNTGGKSNNIHIQNFCIMFAGLHGIGPGQCENFEVDGCVIGYIGGKNLYLGNTSIGNGIEMWGNVKGARIHDNYVFQCFDAGITHQSNNGMDYSVDEDDIYYTDNLVEYCLYSFEAFVPQKDTGTSYDAPKYFEKYTSRMGDVYIENNICRYAGYGWGTLDRSSNAACDLQYRAGMHEETLKISGNIFDRPRHGVALMTTVAKKELVVFTNNTILKESKRKVFNMQGDSVNMHEDVTSFMSKYFSDFSGTTLTEVK